MLMKFIRYQLSLKSVGEFPPARLLPYPFKMIRISTLKVYPILLPSKKFLFRIINFYKSILFQKINYPSPKLGSCWGCWNFVGRLFCGKQ